MIDLGGTSAKQSFGVHETSFPTSPPIRSESHQRMRRLDLKVERWNCFRLNNRTGARTQLRFRHPVHVSLIIN